MKAKRGLGNKPKVHERPGYGGGGGSGSWGGGGAQGGLFGMQRSLHNKAPASTSSRMSNPNYESPKAIQRQNFKDEVRDGLSTGLKQKSLKGKKVLQILKKY